MKKISDRLKLLRGEDAQATAARKLGIAQQGWARYESGAATPGAEVIHRICSKFNISADWLLGFTDSRQGTSAPSKAAMDAQLKELEEENAKLKTELARLIGELDGMRFALKTLKPE